MDAGGVEGHQVGQQKHYPMNQAQAVGEQVEPVVRAQTTCFVGRTAVTPDWAKRMRHASTIAMPGAGTKVRMLAARSNPVDGG